MKTLQLIFSLGFAIGCLDAAPQSVSFSQSAQQVDGYDFVEVTASIAPPNVANPFMQASLSGSFENSNGSKKWNVEGFCDSSDGRLFRIRFMPPQAGAYRFTVTYREANFQKNYAGQFRAIDGHRRGPVRIDAKYPWHFIWEGTGEHYFFNGTTAYWLIGWKDDRVINYSLERLHRLKVNRVRVTIAGRTNMFYGEPVMLGENFTVYVTPWPAEKPDDIYHPGFDYTRFDVAYWQKFERALRFARERDMIISVVFDMGDNKVHPEAASDNEYRFIHYAVDRFGAFSNITWDLGDDLDHYRDDKWTHDTGTLIKQWDPYRHLATSHPVSDTRQDRTSDWFDFTSFQEWSRDQHNYMLSQRKRQQQTGRIIPQTNEEYGYEDHYPLWAPGLGSDSAETLRRTAWDILMAGGYQTAGESARRGTNVWPDTGGGWMNGRGDDTMTMFVGYGHMVDFFTSFEWWKTAPHDDLVDKGKYCLAQPGEIYAIYLPSAGKVTVRLEPGRYEATWFNAFNGEKIPLGPVYGRSWTSPEAPSHNDWVLLLLKENSARK
jgi:Protein of unknown function (DUF4038)/Domain of unknown function (DUF5060)/Putative collagen-binding domain of a collagenase